MSKAQFIPRFDSSSRAQFVVSSEDAGGLVLGSNCGFVTETPTADPDNFQAGSDGQAFALMHTSPAGNNKVVEIGFWQGESDNAAAAYNVGIYADNAGSPGALIATQSSGQSTTVNTSGWYKYTGLNLSLTAATDYWISVGMEPVNPANNMDYLSAPGSGVALKFDSLANSTLLDPFEVEGGNANILYSIYAKYEAVPAKTQIFMHHYKMMAGA